VKFKLCIMPYFNLYEKLIRFMIIVAILETFVAICRRSCLKARATERLHLKITQRCRLPPRPRRRRGRRLSPKISWKSVLTGSPSCPKERYSQLIMRRIRPEGELRESLNKIFDDYEKNGELQREWDDETRLTRLAALVCFLEGALMEARQLAIAAQNKVLH
jgi:hypothetical protein